MMQSLNGQIDVLIWLATIGFCGVIYGLFEIKKNLTQVKDCLDESEVESYLYRIKHELIDAAKFAAKSPLQKEQEREKEITDIVNQVLSDLEREDIIVRERVWKSLKDKSLNA